MPLAKRKLFNYFLSFLCLFLHSLFVYKIESFSKKGTITKEDVMENKCFYIKFYKDILQCFFRFS